MNDDDGRTTAKFLRGLTMGALVGAVLAGSSIWTRRHRAGSRHAEVRADALTRDSPPTPERPTPR